MMSTKRSQKVTKGLRYIPGQKNNKNNNFLLRLAFALIFTYFGIQGFLTDTTLLRNN